MNDFYRYEKYNKQSLEYYSKKYNVPVCMILNANDVISEKNFENASKIKIPYPCYCERNKTCIMDKLVKSTLCLSKHHSYNANYLEYTIQKGETLFDITKKHNVTESVIIRLNNLKSPKDIKHGAMIKIPVFDFDTMIYNVLPRDTLKSIADNFGLDINEIAKINSIEVYENIYPSMRLILPKRKEI